MDKGTEKPLPTGAGSGSREEMLMLLNRIIDEEINKPEPQTDTSLITECAEYIKLLEGGLDTVSKEELDRLYARIRAKGDRRKSGVRGKRRPAFLRISAVIAAALLAVFGTLTVLAAAQGYGSAWELVKAKASEIASLFPGEKAEYGNVTVVKYGQSTEYSSAEDFVRGETLPVMIPSGLPEGLQLKRIIMMHTDADGHYEIAFIFNDKNCSCIVRNLIKLSDTDSLYGASVYTTLSGETFTVIQIPDGGYQSVCQKDGYEYVVTAPDRELLLQIINCIKEVQK